MLVALWPQRWNRQQRSNATLISALVLMVLALAALGRLLSFLPEPIGSNAEAFSAGARTTLWLTLVSGTLGLLLGTSAALARTARWRAPNKSNTQVAMREPPVVLPKGILRSWDTGGKPMVTGTGKGNESSGWKFTGRCEV